MIHLRGFSRGRCVFCLGPLVVFALWMAGAASVPAADQPAPAAVQGVELQPLAAQVRRVIEALEYLGAPLRAEEIGALEKASANQDAAAGVAEIQRILDPHCLVGVQVNPEMRVKAAQGTAAPTLVEQGWRTFLVKVHNEAGTTSALRVASPNARPVHNAQLPRSSDSPGRGNREPKLPASELWLDLEMFGKPPLKTSLSGLKLEYRVLSLYSRDPGQREAKLTFDVGQGTQDLGFRSETDILFHCEPAREVELEVLDENGAPTTAMFVVRDHQGRVYPSQAKRLAPDFAFHPQVYRASGEKLKLPDGEYTIEYTRGPEYLSQNSRLSIRGSNGKASFKLRRWIDPSEFGWWSGDHHIHAAGCAHYTAPTEGVFAADMYRHCQGEDLKVGSNLTWGPCFDFQKQFFTGKDDVVSEYPYLLHYDVEVSGFGSHQSGHLVLLRLKEDIYPGGDSDKHWPTLGLNTLRWARKQGAVCGPAHSGWGLEVQTDELPNYEIPPYSGIGANEYIVDVTHEVPGPDGKLVPAVDFISTVDTPYVWELNMWYHTLNVGFRTRISGETDFPCIYGERVGLGRSYVKLDGKLSYDAWCEGIRQGRNYVGDGRSHLLDFQIQGVKMGENGSELKLPEPATVKATARVAAYLPEKPNPDIHNRSYSKQPYWDIERARIGESREVPVELIVNGIPVGKQVLLADGNLREVSFETKIEKSSWAALRILGSSHSNPIFILVGESPIRASVRSAEWCLKGVEKCWAEKERFIKPAELADARAAYEHARQTYRRLIAEAQQ